MRYKVTAREQTANGRGLSMFSAVFKTRWAQIAAVMTLAASVIAPLLAGLEYWQVSRDGVDTIGRILRLEVNNRRGDWLMGPEYRIQYAYKDAEGYFRRSWQSVDAKTFASLEGRPSGAPIGVRYSRGMPIASTIDIHRMRREVVLLSLIGAAFWGLITFSIVLAARRSARVQASGDYPTIG